MCLSATARFATAALTGAAGLALGIIVLVGCVVSYAFYFVAF
jgi:hypothetical protein